MKRNITLGTFITSPLLGFAFGACILLLLLAACVNHIAEEEEALSGECHEVRITTRAGGENLPYPVSVYAFAPDGACVAQQTVTKATDALKLSLPSGTYHLVALAGTDDYTLPEPMTFTSAITLKAGKTTASSALMMGSANITLATIGMGTKGISTRAGSTSTALSATYYIPLPAPTTAMVANTSYPLNLALTPDVQNLVVGTAPVLPGWPSDDEKEWTNDDAINVKDCIDAADLTQKFKDVYAAGKTEWTVIGTAGDRWKVLRRVPLQGD